MLEFQPGKYRRTIIRLWRTIGIGLGLFILYIVAVSFNFFWLFGGMPDLKTLENPKSELASELISEDGKSLGKYFTNLFAISGATILGDGQVALIIDTNALIK